MYSIYRHKEGCESHLLGLFLVAVFASIVFSQSGDFRQHCFCPSRRADGWGSGGNKEDATFVYLDLYCYFEIHKNRADVSVEETNSD